jgi:hypothetical protein
MVGGISIVSTGSTSKQNDRGEPASARESRAATLYSVGPKRGPDHEASMRFSSELRGGGPILNTASKPCRYAGCHHLGSSSAFPCTSVAGC